MRMCMCAKLLQSCLTLCNLQTVALQAPLSMEFRQEYWSRLPCPPPEDLPNPGNEPSSLCLLQWHTGSVQLAPPGKTNMKALKVFWRLQNMNEVCQQTDRSSDRVIFNSVNYITNYHKILFSMQYENTCEACHRYHCTFINYILHRMIQDLSLDFNKLISFSGGLVVKHPSANAGDAVSIPGVRKIPVKKGNPYRSPEKKLSMYSSVLAWEIPWTEVLVGYSPKRVGLDSVTNHQQQ